jgi:tetratricopeptide (TPR) repeat protein
MPRKVEAFRVFIASPGGLESEREAVKEEIAKFNAERMHEIGIAFTSESWEGVPGGLRRPQALINELVESCDYMILLLGSRWGSWPATDGTYTSGTEEEFFVAKQCISRADRPMLDILVLFKGVPDDQLSDPGEQLRKVIEFKARLEQSKEIFYKTFDELGDLRHEVAIRLRSWANPSKQNKATARETTRVRENNATSNITPPQDHVESAAEISRDRSALKVAEQYEERGLMTQAEAAYAKAVMDSDAVSLERYAKFLRRTGRLSKALEIDRQILAQLANDENLSETIDQRSRILAGIGIVERKLGNLRASRYALHEAVETAREGAPDTLSYTLDNLGITATRSGDYDQAEEYFQEALAIRQRQQDSAGQARSLTNLSRLYKSRGDLNAAAHACEDAMRLLANLHDRAGLASAHATMGEISEMLGDLDGAENSYRSALEINEALGMPDNIAMSLNQVARILLEREDFSTAERYAERALTENQLSSNREGTVASTHLLGRIFSHTDRESLAIGLLEEAVSNYRAIGNKNGEAWACLHLAKTLRRVGRDKEALETLHKARFIAEAAGNASIRALAAKEVS